MGEQCDVALVAMGDREDLELFLKENVCSKANITRLRGEEMGYNYDPLVWEAVPLSSDKLILQMAMPMINEMDDPANVWGADWFADSGFSSYIGQGLSEVRSAGIDRFSHEFRWTAAFEGCAPTEWFKVLARLYPEILFIMNYETRGEEYFGLSLAYRLDTAISVIHAELFDATSCAIVDDIADLIKDRTNRDLYRTVLSRLIEWPEHMFHYLLEEEIGGDNTPTYLDQRCVKKVVSTIKDMIKGSYPDYGLSVAGVYEVLSYYRTTHVDADKLLAEIDEKWSDNERFVLHRACTDTRFKNKHALAFVEKTDPKMELTL